MTFGNINHLPGRILLLLAAATLFTLSWMQIAAAQMVDIGKYPIHGNLYFEPEVTKTLNAASNGQPVQVFVRDIYDPSGSTVVGQEVRSITSVTVIAKNTDTGAAMAIAVTLGPSRIIKPPVNKINTGGTQGGTQGGSQISGAQTGGSKIGGAQATGTGTSGPTGQAGTSSGQTGQGQDQGAGNNPSVNTTVFTGRYLRQDEKTFLTVNVAGNTVSGNFGVTDPEPPKRDDGTFQGMIVESGAPVGQAAWVRVEGTFTRNWHHYVTGSGFHEERLGGDAEITLIELRDWNADDTAFRVTGHQVRIKFYAKQREDLNTKTGRINTTLGALKAMQERNYYK